MKILLVDDEIEFVSTLATRLNLRGVEADWVGSPSEAVTRVKEECYDLAVLDVKMPRIDGIELKRRLQRHCPNMEFIFLTGHGSSEAFQAGSAEAGPENYLMKPLRMDELMAKIKEINARRKLGADDE